jgi:hypothetical protein
MINGGTFLHNRISKDNLKEVNSNLSFSNSSIFLCSAARRPRQVHKH